MRRWFWLPALCLMVFCGPALAQQLAPATAPPGESAGPKPRLMVEQPVYEAGDIEAGTQVSHEFLIRNEGDAPLEITEVKPGCGCSAAMFDRVVAPGETGRITISVKVYREWAGQELRKTAWVLTNDPLAPQLRLVVSGLVQEPPAGRTAAPADSAPAESAPAESAPE